MWFSAPSRRRCPIWLFTFDFRYLTLHTYSQRQRMHKAGNRKSDTGCRAL